MLSRSPLARWRCSARGRYTVIGFGLLMTVGVTAVLLIQRKMSDAISWFIILGVYDAALIVFASRSETVAILADRDMDERRQHIEEFAAAATGRVMALVLVTGFVVQLIRGADAQLWANLCAAFGLVYIGAMLWARKRS